MVAACLAACLVEVYGCGKGVCQDYGTEPRFDSSSRPPSKSVLGRATWTVLVLVVYNIIQCVYARIQDPSLHHGDSE